MAYIEFEKSVREEEWSMHRLHSHTHYEIYFLTKGSRTFYLANALLTLRAPTVMVIPPNVMHKTEGGGFERYNINVSPSYLDDFQKDCLDKLSLHVLRPNDDETKMIVRLLQDAMGMDKRKKYTDSVLHALLTHAVFMLGKFTVLANKPTKLTGSVVPEVVLKVTKYLEDNFEQKLTLDNLAQSFFIAKTTLIYNFKKYLGCSPMDFLLNTRLTKAKEMLATRKLSVGEIADRCGFSSANYFGLIFKQKEGLSPLNYRKLQKTKT